MLLDLFIGMLDFVKDLASGLFATYLAYVIAKWWKEHDAGGDSES